MRQLDFDLMRLLEGDRQGSHGARRTAFSRSRMRLGVGVRDVSPRRILLVVSSGALPADPARQASMVSRLSTPEDRSRTTPATGWYRRRRAVSSSRGVRWSSALPRGASFVWMAARRLAYSRISSRYHMPHPRGRSERIDEQMVWGARRPGRKPKAQRTTDAWWCTSGARPAPGERPAPGADRAERSTDRKWRRWPSV